MPKRSVILVQLPIPPVGPEPIRGNVPLAAGYLKMFARQRGLEAHFDIQILPTVEANTFGDCGLVEAILARDPWMVGFTCYLWNIERTLWIAEQIKQRRPNVRIIIGGPEVTLDNAWVLEHPAIDYAAIGEGEQTFAELLTELVSADEPQEQIAGLWNLRVRNRKRHASHNGHQQNHSPFPIPHSPFAFTPRAPLPNLNPISSPYLAGILDAADEQMLLLETIRGCIFKCKFCYYPKSYDDLYFVSEEKIVANLEHAQQHAAKEVVLLDPTLNQRGNFGDFLKLLAHCNPEQQFTYFGELRAEGITPAVAKLLHEANFTEVEIGLQSIDPLAMELMDRHNNLKAFERGARAMLDLGIKVKVDLIIGLPGDTVDSVRRGLEYIHQSGLYSSVQVFNLAVLPGTAFRQEAEQLGLIFQDRPPYYVLETPTLATEQLYDLMTEAEDIFETEFDPLPEVQLSVGSGQWSEEHSKFGVHGPAHKAADDIGGPLPSPLAGEGPGVRGQALHWTVNLDETESQKIPPPPNQCTQAFTLWLKSTNFAANARRTAQLVEQLLEANPFTTLQIVLEPTGEPQLVAETLNASFCETILRAAFRNPTYLDRFYSVQPGRLKGAKRLIVLLPDWERHDIPSQWFDEIGELATVVGRDAQMSDSIPTTVVEQV